MPEENGNCTCTSVKEEQQHFEVVNGKRKEVQGFSRGKKIPKQTDNRDLRSHWDVAYGLHMSVLQILRQDQ